MKRIAVVMSGHARMVPQGYHLLASSVGKIPDCQHEIFSMTWTDGDHRSHQYSANGERTRRILEGLGPRCVMVPQEQKLSALHERFLREASIPEGPDSPLILDVFKWATGQIWGFLMALDHWRDELSGFDAIIRSRWDRVLDADCINAILGNRPFRGSHESWMITCDVSVNDGQLYYSGDSIYGPAKRWLDLIPSEEAATVRAISAVKRWYEQNRGNPSSILYQRRDKWFSSHWLWSTIFDGTDVSMASLGNCFSINPGLADYPIEEITEKLVSSFPPRFLARENDQN